MKSIKNILNIKVVLAAIAGVALFASCDNIDPDDRFIPVEWPDAPRNVLVIEFTGQLCTNCPTGAATIHNMQELYPGNVIAVGLHPKGVYFTNWSNPRGKVDLTCDLANVYYDYYGQPSAFPCASVDFGTLDDRIPRWPDMISEALTVDTDASIQLQAAYNPDSREVTVDYQVDYLGYHNGETSILCWVIENGIVGGQMDGGRPTYTYVHNHVLRSSLNGEWGEVIGNSFAPGEPVNGTASGVLADKWEAANCQIVVFIFNTADKKVQQAAIIDVPAMAAAI